MFECVKDPKLKWPSGRVKRDATNGIVIHHTANRGVSPQALHQNALNDGWKGFPYNFYVMQDGTVWEGRGLEYIGSHSGRKHVRNDSEWAAGEHNNNETVGIGFEGHYHPSGSYTPDVKMPSAQFNAGVRLIKDILATYGEHLFIKGHKQMPSTSTACPGNYFPFEELVAAARDKSFDSEIEEKDDDELEVYVVKKGDTLSRIAADNGLTLNELISLNPQIKDPNKINIGDEIYLTEGHSFVLTRTIKVSVPLMSGEDVKVIQSKLNKLISAGLKEDGKYGNASAAAVKKFQKNNKLTVDGIVGKKTAEKLGLVWGK